MKQRILLIGTFLLFFSVLTMAQLTTSSPVIPSPPVPSSMPIGPQLSPSDTSSPVYPGPVPISPSPTIGESRRSGGGGGNSFRIASCGKVYNYKKYYLKVITPDQTSCWAEQMLLTKGELKNYRIFSTRTEKR